MVLKNNVNNEVAEISRISVDGNFISVWRYKDKDHLLLKRNEDPKTDWNQPKYDHVEVPGFQQRFDDYTPPTKVKLGDALKQLALIIVREKRFPLPTTDAEGNPVAGWEDFDETAA